MAINPLWYWQDQPIAYSELVRKVDELQAYLDKYGLKTGQVVALDGDYSPNAIAAMLALINRGTIVVPFTSAAAQHREEFFEIAQVEEVLSLDDADQYKITRRSVIADHPFVQQLRDLGDPGLVLFSSGSTGKSKAALHNFAKLLEKFKVPRNKLCTLTFLLLDHIGGINTLFYTLSQRWDSGIRAQPRPRLCVRGDCSP